MTDFINLDGNCLACDTAGESSNPPIIFVHGLMSYRGVWRRTMDVLKDRHYCVAFDLLGFGDSDKPKDGDYSIQAQAQRVLRVADQFGFRQFRLAGHSMGAQIALHLASGIGLGRVSKLVSVSGVVTGKLTRYVRLVNMQLVETGRYAPGVFNLIHSMSRQPWFANWAFNVWFFRPADLPFDAWAEDRKYALNREIAVPSFEAYHSLSRNNLAPKLADISIPVLAIHGEQDGTVPVADARLLEERTAKAKLVLLDQCGHFPMYEKFNQYIAPMKEFLD